MNNKGATLILLLLGILIVFLGVTGRVGVFLGALFTPSAVEVNE